MSWYIVKALCVLVVFLLLLHFAAHFAAKALPLIISLLEVLLPFGGLILLLWIALSLFASPRRKW